MKKGLIISLSIVLSTLMITSCTMLQNTNQKQRGAMIGTTGGAAAGAAIGSQIGKGNTALGAIIGAVIGGVSGAYIGDRMDRQAEKIEQTIPGAEVKRVGEGINVTFDEKSGVYFATNKSNINTTSAATLEKLSNILIEFPNSNILIEGHTDNTGKDAYNYTLSEKRAEAVSSFLKAKGISATRLITKWYGESQPKYDNSTAEGRAKNRRVELAIIANEEMKKEAEMHAR